MTGRDIKQLALYASLLLIITTSCSQNKVDNDIKADITTKAKTEINFAGVDYTVDDGVVTLTGQCPDEKTKDEVESKVKDIAGVKSVIDDVTIAPVLIGTDHSLKESTDSVLKQYASVKADVKDSVIIVKGQADKKEVQKILQGLSSLHPKQLNNQLSIK